MRAEMSARRQTLTVPLSLRRRHLHRRTGREGQRRNGTVMTVSQWIVVRKVDGGMLTPGSHRMRLPVQLPREMTEGARQNTNTLAVPASVASLYAHIFVQLTLL